MHASESNLNTEPRLDLLLVSERAVWPTDQGFAIRGSHLALALARRGLRVAIASMEKLPDDTPANLRALHVTWPTAEQRDLSEFQRGWAGWARPLRLRLADHQGRVLVRYAGVVPLVRQHRPAVVVGLGLHAPLLLRGISADRGVARIWYAADELVRFELSCLWQEGWRAARRRLHKAALYAGLENLFVRGLEGAIGVSPVETRLLRLVAGARDAVTIRNGVDLDYYRPTPQPAQSRSLVFWGRMDFHPNIDAMTAFVRQLWPTLKQRYCDATLTIVGKAPTPQVLALAETDGVHVTGAVEDIREHARAAAVTILPMRCGGGIKNKLLEAGAMGLAIVASPRAVEGLQWDRDAAPALVCRTRRQWLGAIERLWSNEAESQRWRQRSRQWVERYHNWDAAAGQLVDWLREWTSLGEVGAKIIRRQEAA